MADEIQQAKFIYNSNRLDGVHIAFETTLDLVQHPPNPLEDSVDIPAIIGGGDKTYLRHHVLSHFNALCHLPELARAPRITEEHVRDLHRRLMNDVILSNGEYRECTLRYKAIPPVSPALIPQRMQRVLSILERGFERAQDKAILAWQVHHEFIHVHPFIEGNGRMARLLLNLVRFRAGLDLEVVPFAESRRYLESIQAYGQSLASLAR